MSKQINFTIVPDDPRRRARQRLYANFCAVAHTPFDMTLTFCDVRPLSERDIQNAEASQTVPGAAGRPHRAAVRGRARTDCGAAGAAAHVPGRAGGQRRLRLAQRPAALSRGMATRRCASRAAAGPRCRPSNARGRDLRSAGRPASGRLDGAEFSQPPTSCSSRRSSPRNRPTRG